LEKKRPGTEEVLNELSGVNTQQQQYCQTNVCIAAAITAYSRMNINSVKVYCLNNDIEVFYSDTDSIVTNIPLPEEFLHESRIGLLKLEHEIQNGYFIAPKLYRFEYLDKGIVKVKSVSRGYGGELTLEQIETLYEGISIAVDKTKWHRDWKNHTVWFEMDKILNITGEFSKRIKVLTQFPFL
jgi:hypothetical protein